MAEIYIKAALCNEVVAAGAFTPLLQLVSSGGYKEGQSSSALLIQLAKHASDEQCRAIVSAGAVPVLVEAVRQFYLRLETGNAVESLVLRCREAQQALAARRTENQSYYLLDCSLHPAHRLRDFELHSYANRYRALTFSSYSLTLPTVKRYYHQLLHSSPSDWLHDGRTLLS